MLKSRAGFPRVKFDLSFPVENLVNCERNARKRRKSLLNLIAIPKTSRLEICIHAFLGTLKEAKYPRGNCINTKPTPLL